MILREFTTTFLVTKSYADIMISKIKFVLFTFGSHSHTHTHIHTQQPFRFSSPVPPQSIHCNWPSPYLNSIVLSFGFPDTFFEFAMTSLEDQYNALPLKTLKLETTSFDNFISFRKKDIDEFCDVVPHKFRGTILRLWEQHPRNQASAPRK